MSIPSQANFVLSQIIEYSYLLNEWEEKFIKNLQAKALSKKHYELSEKQHKTLENIHKKLKYS